MPQKFHLQASHWSKGDSKDSKIKILRVDAVSALHSICSLHDAGKYWTVLAFTGTIKKGALTRGLIAQNYRSGDIGYVQKLNQIENISKAA